MNVITFEEFKNIYKPTVVSQTTPEYNNLLLPKADFNNILGNVENNRISLKTIWSLVEEIKIIDPILNKSITKEVIYSGFNIKAKGYYITEIPHPYNKIMVVFN